MAFRSPLLFRAIRWLLAIGAAGATTGALFLGAVYLYVQPQLPSIDELAEVQLQEPLRIYAANGALMRVYGAKHRMPIDIEQIPERVKNAFIAAEDDRFYEHPGVDWMGIARAAWYLLLTGEKEQGGSTITMQVARNYFLTREKTYIRKIKEIFLALKIERELTKPEILELYLNKIYLGQGAYGIAAAAQAYFGKDVDELTLTETALLAGLPKAPSYYNPIERPEEARERRDYVLRRMFENDMISQRAYHRALATPVTVSPHGPAIELRAPYAAEMARQVAVRRLGEDAYTGGYKVYTTIVPEEQRAATAALREALVAYERRHGYVGPVAYIDADRLPELEVLRRLVARGASDHDPENPADNPAAATIGTPAAGSAPADADEAADAPAADGASRITLAPGMLGPEQLDMILSDYEPAGHLDPALVVAVDEPGAVVYRRGLGLAPMPWKSMDWAAPRIEGTLYYGEAPEKPTDVVLPGDIVYVAPDDDGAGVRLAQVPKVSGALVALDPRDGAIRAIVGGFDFHRSKFNRAVDARRQPGSNIKPFIYTAALAKGMTPATLINDAPVVFEDSALETTWRPTNYSGHVFGPTRLREGLVHSRNLVSIRVLMQIGVEYAIDFVQRFGFEPEQLAHNLTLALGNASVSPLQIATGYATFANGGFKIEPYLVTRIVNYSGEVIYRADPAIACPKPCAIRQRLKEQRAAGPEGAVGVAAAVHGQTLPGPRLAERVLEPRVAYIIRDILRDVARRGTAQGTRVLGRDDIGAKTGTTDKQVDAWFTGFNSSIVATVWVGYDRPHSLGNYEYGARAAMPAWLDFMRVAMADTPEVWPEMPPGMVTVRIDPQTGEYAGPNDEDAIFEIFRVEKAPQPTAIAGSGRDAGGGDGVGSAEPLF